MSVKMNGQSGVDAYFDLINACYTMTEEYRTTLRQVGMANQLTENEMLVLVHLVRNPGARTQKKLQATNLPLSISSICRMVESLRRKGYLTTELDENDRRSWIIHLDESGIALGEKTCQVLSQRMNDIVGSNPGLDLERFIDTLCRAASGKGRRYKSERCGMRRAERTKVHS